MPIKLIDDRRKTNISIERPNKKNSESLNLTQKVNLLRI